MKKILICTACVVALSSASAPARTTTARDAGGLSVAAQPELIVQARQSAAQPGAGRAVAGQQIKLFAPATLAPALPGAKGAVKNDAGFDQDPMQCTTGQDGTCAIALPREQFPVAATYEIDADVAEQAGVNARPGPVAGPVAGLFAFGFMPAMPLAYDGLIINPDGTKYGTNFRNFNHVSIAIDGTKWCTYGDGGPKTTPITPKSPGEGVFDPGQPETTPKTPGEGVFDPGQPETPPKSPGEGVFDPGQPETPPKSPGEGVFDPGQPKTPPKTPGVVTKPDGTTVVTQPDGTPVTISPDGKTVTHQEGTKTVYNPEDKTLTTYDTHGKKSQTIKDVTPDKAVLALYGKPTSDDEPDDEKWHTNIYFANGMRNSLGQALTSQQLLSTIYKATLDASFRGTYSFHLAYNASV